MRMNINGRGVVKGHKQVNPRKFKENIRKKNIQSEISSRLVVAEETLEKQKVSFWKKRHCSNWNNAKTKQKGSPTFGKTTESLSLRKHILLISKKKEN